MGKQIFQITGMSQDLADSKISSEKAFEIKNMRVTAQENSNMPALISEKGNIEIPLYEEDGITLYNIPGNVVGYCTLNEFIVLFTHSVVSDINVDYILRLSYDTSTPKKMLVHELYHGNLGFNELGEGIHIDTHTCYETENNQKVYWIDGVHQPRFINIVADEETQALWLERTNPFDFNPPLKYEEEVSIEKTHLTGLFPAGTIQYVFSYFNRWGQQTAAFHTSPIYYTSPINRGGSPEESISNAFKIAVYNADENYDYIRVYSVLRTSENGTPYCKLVGDFTLNNIEKTVITNKLKRYKTNLINYISPETPYGSNYLESIDTLRAFKNKENIPSGAMDDDTQLELDIENFRVPINIYPYYKYEFDYNIWICYTDDSGNNVQYTTPMQQVIPGSDFYEFVSSEYKVSIIYASGISKWVVNLIEPPTPPTPTPQSAIKAPINLIEDEEITTNEVGISIIDNNTTGSVVDYAEIQFLGGANIIPNTLEEKQNTLFFGNYELITPPISPHLVEIITGENGIKIDFKYKNKAIPKVSTGVYAYESQLDYNESEITTFKGGESYYFGITFQDNVGQWSSVIPLGYYTNTLYPQDNIDYFYPVEAYALIPLAVITELNNTNFKRYKLVVYDNLLNKVVCQGVLSPTVFNRERQKDVYAWPSWFFRPISPWGYGSEDRYVWGKILSNRHFCNIPSYESDHDYLQTVVNDSNIEDNPTPEFHLIQGMECTNGELQGASGYLKGCMSAGALYNEKDFYIDWNVLTLNSPDIEFEQVTNLNEGLKLKIVGLVPATASQQNLYVTIGTSSKTKSSNKDYVRNINNFIFRDIRVSNRGEEAIYGPYTTFSWYDINPLIPIDTVDTVASYSLNGWMPIYPWNCDYQLSYLTIDITSSPAEYKSDKYSTLQNKVFANMKYSGNTIYGNQLLLGLNDYKLLFTEYQSIQFKINNEDTYWESPKNYSNTCDTVLAPSPDYYEYLPFLITTSQLDKKEILTLPFHGDNNSLPFQKLSTSVRYKSTPHAVMELSWNNEKQTVIPKLNLGNGTEYTVIPGESHRTGWPFWAKERAVDNKDYDINDYLEISAVIDKFSDGVTEINNTTLTSGQTEIKTNGSSTYTPENLILSGSYPSGVCLVNYDTNVNMGDTYWNVAGSSAESYYLIVSKSLLEQYISELKLGQIVYFPNVTFSVNGEYIKCLFYIAKINTTDVILIDYPRMYNYYMWHSMPINGGSTATASEESSNWRLQNGSKPHIGKYTNVSKSYSTSTTLPGSFPVKWYNNNKKLFMTLSPIIGTDEESNICGYYAHTSQPTKTEWDSPERTAFCDSKKQCKIVEEFYLPEQEFNEDTISYPIDNPFKGYYYLAEFYDPNVPEINEKDITYRDCGLPAMIGDNLYGTYGDTYYQRYDCLKTYPYSPEDQNQIVEILSFMCETRVNIDGRYDKMRGLSDNTIVTNTNFNLLNKTYSQRDNLQSYNYLDPKYFNADTFGNQIIWTKTKQYNEKVDSWTNIIPTSVLSLQGDKGNITKLINWNNNLLCFQDKAIAKIDYNERVALSTSDGVPVELANSGKVTGYNYLSTTVGCSNKRSVCPTVGGIYFADSNNKEVYLFSGELKNLSKTNGFNTYFYKYNFDTMHTDYDSILKSIYFVNDDSCLEFSEQSGSFESFFSYDNTEMFNFNDEFLALQVDKSIENSAQVKLWRQFGGQYNKFFNKYEDFGFTLVSNDNPTIDKIFTNLEYRADTYKQENNNVVVDTLDSFSTIRATTEYQNTENKDLEYGKNIKKRFRIWRAEIPREEKMRRIRNPWAKITLIKNTDDNKKEYRDKTIVHDMIITYL